MKPESLETNHFMLNEMQDIAKLILSLESKLEQKYRKIPADQSKNNNTDDEQYLNFVNRVHEFSTTHPELCNPEVNWEEFQNDHNSSEFLDLIISRLQYMAVRLSHNKAAHDYNNYMAALADYEYSEIKACRYTSGHNDKAHDLSLLLNELKPERKAS